jgi:hypothetical protein
MFPKSAFYAFSLVKQKRPDEWQSQSVRAAGILTWLLAIGILLSIQGCAANKCDCPKFGGHHLNH